MDSTASRRAWTSSRRSTGPRRLRRRVGRHRAALADRHHHPGGRRLDEGDDLVRMEVDAALRRTDLTGIPVLVQGAHMPLRSELPSSPRPRPAQRLRAVRPPLGHGCRRSGDPARGHRRARDQGKPNLPRPRRSAVAAVPAGPPRAGFRLGRLRCGAAGSPRSSATSSLGHGPPARISTTHLPTAATPGHRPGRRRRVDGRPRRDGVAVDRRGGLSRTTWAAIPRFSSSATACCGWWGCVGGRASDGQRLG